MTVLLVGGQGKVASAVAAALTEIGVAYEALPTRAGQTPASVRVRQTLNALRTSKAAPTTVINCAGRADPTGRASDLAIANIELPRQLARECESLGISFAHISSLAVYGTATHVDSGTRDAPTSRYGASKAAGDEAVLTECPTATCIRLASIQASGANYMRSARQACRALAPLGILDPTTPLPLGGIRNAGRLVAAVALSGIEGVVLHPYEGLTVGDLTDRTLTVKPIVQRSISRTMRCLPGTGLIRRAQLLLDGQVVAWELPDHIGWQPRPDEILSLVES